MKKIVLYFGKGVDGLSGLHCYKSLAKATSLPVVRYKAHQFDAIDFENCALFVMPGGRDKYYHEALKGSKAQRLKQYVQNGGNYLGLCAGGYFGSAMVDFERGQDLEFIQKRELQFFPGVAVGSALGLGKFEYRGYAGADIAAVHVENESIACFFNGGCYFKDANQAANTSIIARYALNNEAAIIDCTVGSGRAILSGVHFEYDANRLTTNQLPQEKLDSLRKSKPFKLMKGCFERFAI